jgi:hypothetical protein
MTAIPPTHLLAVFGKQLTGKSLQQRRVTLHPVHSLVFASYSTSLPDFPSPQPVSLPEWIRKVDIPVWPLCLPSPATYPTLTSLATGMFLFVISFFILLTTSKIYDEKASLGPLS